MSHRVRAESLGHPRGGADRAGLRLRRGRAPLQVEDMTELRVGAPGTQAGDQPAGLRSRICMGAKKYCGEDPGRPASRRNSVF